MQAFMKGVLIACTMVEMINGGRVEATASLTFVFVLRASVPVTSIQRKEVKRRDREGQEGRRECLTKL